MRNLGLSLIAFIIVGLVGVDAQEIKYSFDQCNANSTPSGFDGVIDPSVGCDCGLEGESLVFNNDGGVRFSSDLLEVFSSDFTIDFYLSLGNVSSVTDIMSYQYECNSDSLMSLKYFPNSNEIILELAKNISSYESIVSKFPDNCWNRITITRKALAYTLYINNIRAGVIFPNEEIPMNPKALLSLSSGPCQALGESALTGRIDEFNIYRRALSESELRNSYLFPNEIISDDATIFIGESVDIMYGATCQGNVSWSPNNGLDDPTILEPVASPEESTTYAVNTSDDFCRSVDSITIYVVDPNEFNCEELLLPTAFTPNGDQLNDDFGISNTFIVEELEQFYIMDKWGNRVFEGSKIDDRWDGTYTGKKLNPGTYTYVISYKCLGETYTKVGSVVILV